MSEFSSMVQINSILDNEKISDEKECWGKLPKQTKLVKLFIFTNNYCSTNNYDNTTEKILNIYIKQALERKKLNKKTDIKYNKETEEVEEIYNLLYNKVNNKFTIKKHEIQKKTVKNKKKN